MAPLRSLRADMDISAETLTGLKAFRTVRDSWKSWVPLLAGGILAVGGWLIALGYKQSDSKQLVDKVEALSAKMDHFEGVLQAHGEELAAVTATDALIQSDVRDLKHLADHAQDVADQFKVPRLTGGHRVRRQE